MEKDNSNIQLIYEYAKQVLKDIDSSKNTLNTKLGAVIAFDGLMIRFLSDLPDDSLVVNLPDMNIYLKCKMCLVLKILSSCSLIVSLIFGLWGFKPKKGEKIIMPEELIEKCLDISEEHYRLSLIASWNESIEELVKLRNAEAKMLDRAVLFLGFAAILSAIDVILASILK